MQLLSAKYDIYIANFPTTFYCIYNCQVLPFLMPTTVDFIIVANIVAHLLNVQHSTFHVDGETIGTSCHKKLNNCLCWRFYCCKADTNGE